MTKISLLFLCLFTAISTMTAQTYSGGSGTEQDPYLISSKADMEALATAVEGGTNHSGEYFLLTTDLTNSNAVTNSVGRYAADSRRSFKGIFDGGGHEIELSSSTHGVFGSLDGATVQNLGVQGTISVIGTPFSYAGGICSGASNSTITRCYNLAIVTASAAVGSYAGGICGVVFGESSISNCYSLGNISADAAGGICGTIHGKTSISNCYNLGNIASLWDAGGICGSGGDYESSISSCFSANSTITAKQKSSDDYRNYAGRICVEGRQVNNCYALSTMTINGSAVSNTYDNGSGTTLSSFQSQSWITSNLGWDFNSVWAMPSNGFANQGLPILSSQAQNQTYTIMASAGSNGSILPSGNTIVGFSESKTFTFSPNPGYKINQVLVDGVNNFEFASVASGNYAFPNVRSNHTIYVSFKPQSASAQEVFFEDFEGSESSLTLVNGEQSNQWLIGSGTAYEGNKSAYISNNGSANSYANGASIVHFYQDIPIGVNSTLSFFWKGQGESGYDELKVYLISPSTTPNAGSQLPERNPSGSPISTTTLLGTFGGSTSWQQETIDLSAFAGTTKRLVFSWCNDNEGTTQPPIAIDNIALYGTYYAGGDGTENNPYLISSKANMEYLAAVVNHGNDCSGTYFLLTQDLTGANNTITTGIGYSSSRFSGIFDGGGHEIEINNTIGVFGYLSNATIRNLSVKGTVSAPTTKPILSYAGGICGYASGSTISNCYNSSSVSSNSYSSRDDKPTSYSGGICGYASGCTISGCYNTGTVYSYSSNSSNYYASFAYAGGICGYNDSNSKISNCFAANTTIIGKSSAGRIVGNNNDVVNCYALSSMTINGSAIDSSPASSSKNGKSQSLSSFQSKSWLEETLLWNFNELWKMSSITSMSQGLPIFKNQQEIPAPTNIKNLDTDKLQIYPNPAKHDLFIKSDSPIEKVEIYNQTGQLVLKDANFVEKIDISHLPVGIYLARIYTENIPITKKFIVTK